MLSRDGAFARLRALPDTVAADQAYVIDAFQPSDAEGVAELFYRVYGESYPMAMYYDPDAIRQAVERKELIPVLGRLADGKIVGFASLYKSSPPFAGLLELGLGMVHPAYRGSFILFHLFNYLNSRMLELPGLEAVFGEAVCDSVITQHASSLFGFRECALELDLMPGGGSGRISCLVMFRNLKDLRRELAVPSSLRPEVEALVARLELERELRPARNPGQSQETSRASSQVFSFAGLMRGQLFQTGQDFRVCLDREENAALSEGCRRFQWFLNLGDPGVELAVNILRAQGYAFGGIIPRWFDSDALLMFKLLDPPALEGLKLYSDQARELLDMVLASQVRS